ncbi:MAG TPA: oligosaccharide flippase family protein [Bacteroidia bacterium]|jgi:O-antigen/teichoic acid export membrane protein|nr:oligosaccharide flippase family protein [Bacteroidia bacterium]
MSLNRNIFYSFLAQFPNLLFGIIAGVFMTRIMGPEGRGVYSIFQANIDFFVLILGINVNTGLVYFVSSKRIAEGKLIGVTIITVCSAVLLMLMIIGVVMLVRGKLLFPVGYDTIFFIGYFIVSFFIGLANVCFSGIFSGHKNFRIVNISSIAVSLLKLILFAVSFCFFYYGVFKITILTVFALLLLTQLITFLINILIYWKLYAVPPVFAFNYNEDIRPLFKFIGVSHIGNIVNFLNYRMDVWLVTYFKNLEQLGYYTLAVNIAQFTWLISIPISNVLFPYLSEQKDKTDENMLAKYSRINCTALIFTAGTLYLFSDFIIRKLYGSNFVESIVPLRILLIGNLFLMIQRPFRTLLFAKSDTLAVLLINISGLVFTVILDFILIPVQGIIGASIASDVAYTGMLICILVYCFRKYKLKIHNYMIITWHDILETKSFIYSKLYNSK